MVKSDDEELIIIPPAVKAELEAFGYGHEEEFLDPLSPNDSAVPPDEEADHVHERKTESRRAVRTCRAKKPPNNNTTSSTTAKTPTKTKDSSSRWKPPRQIKPAETLAHKSEVRALAGGEAKSEVKVTIVKVKIKVESKDDDEEETTPQLPKSKRRRKRVSEMSAEELEATRIKGREATRRRRERQRLSRGASVSSAADEEGEETPHTPESKWRKARDRVAKYTDDKVGLEEEDSEDGDAQRNNCGRDTKVRGYRRKRVDEIAPEKLAAIRAKRTAETRRRRARMTEEQLEERRRRDRERRREKRRLLAATTIPTEAEKEARRLYFQRKRQAMTEEQRAEERQRKTIKRLMEKATMTEEELAERRQRLYMKNVARAYRMTREEREERRQRKNEKLREMVAQMTPEEIERNKEKNRERYRKMTLEQREKFFANQEKYKKRRLDKLRQDPERMNRIRKRAPRHQLPIGLDARERRRMRDKIRQMKRKLMVQDLLDSGMTMEQVMQKLETPEQRNRRLIQARTAAAKRKLAKQLSETGAPPDQIAAQVNALEERCEPLRKVVYRPRPCRFKRVDRSELCKILELNPDSIVALQTELRPPPPPVNVNCAGDYDNDDGGGGGQEEDDYSPNSSPPPPDAEEARSPPQPPLPQQEYQENRVTHQEPGSRSASEDGDAKRRRSRRTATSRRTALVQPEASPPPPPSPVNNDMDYDDDDCGGGGHEDDNEDYFPNSSPPPQERDEAKVSYQPSTKTSSTCATPSTSTYQQQPPPVVFERNENPPQAKPPPHPKENQRSSITPQEPGSRSHSEDGGGAKRPNRQPTTSRRKTGAGRKDYGPRGGFRATLESTKKLATCDECGNVYSECYLTEHKNHFHHKSFVDGKCVLCGERFPTGKLFYSHFLADHDKCKYKGKRLCGSRPTRRNNSKSMTAEELEKWRESLVVCELCGNSYTREGIYDHQNVHHNQHFVNGKCTICNASIPNTRSFLLHFRKEHKKEKRDAANSKQKFVCDACGKGFREKQNLVQHFHFNHGDGTKEENFSECPICEKKFKYKHVMEAHVRKYHPREADTAIRRHECRHCRQKFRTQNELGDHISTQHPESYFPCPHCKSIRSSKQNLYFHIFCCKKKPKGVMKELAQKGIVSLEKTPLKCEVCEKEMILRSLKRHYNIAHGVEEDEYSCGQCPKMFKAREYLVNHMDEAHGILFDDELKEKVRKMYVADKSMLEIKGGSRRGRKKKSEMGGTNVKGRHGSRRRRKKVVKNVASEEEEEEEELSANEDSSEDDEDIENEALKRISRVGTRSRPRVEVKRELPNVEKEKKLVISVVRMSEEEIWEAVFATKGG